MTSYTLGLRHSSTPDKPRLSLRSTLTSTSTSTSTSRDRSRQELYSALQQTSSLLNCAALPRLILTPAFHDCGRQRKIPSRDTWSLAKAPPLPSAPSASRSLPSLHHNPPDSMSRILSSRQAEELCVHTCGWKYVVRVSSRLTLHF